MKKYLLSIDIGGTNIKTGIFDNQGNLLSISSVENKILSPYTGWAELSPNYIWDYSL